MADRPLHTVVRHIQQLAGGAPGGEPGDRELLERFAAHRDEAAFAALVRRHGPMVRGVCQRLLRQAPDVDDAFQATFLVLVRKAHSIRKSASVASWLYGVAFRSACRARADAARRQARERRPAPPPAADPGLEVAWRELCAVLDAEVHGLPEQCRAALVLCYLEGRTRDQAARHLGWSLRTLDRRLGQGRKLLRARLVRRGLALPAGLLAAGLTGSAAAAAVPPSLVEATVKAAALVAAGKWAAEAASGQVAVLVQGVLRAMFWTKLKIVAAVAALVAGLAGSGVLLLASGGPSDGRPSAEEGQPQAAGQAAPLHAAVQPGQEGALGRGQPEDVARLAKERALSRLNLKKLALAMGSYQDANGHFPAPALYSGQAAAGGGGMDAGGGGMAAMMGGKGAGPAAVDPSAGPTAGGSSPGAGGPGGLMGAGGAPGGMGMGMGGRVARPKRIAGRALLSWRVALLPYLGEEALYRQFKLDEPWDGPTNKRLLANIPPVYAPVRATPAFPSSSTFYQVFVGPGAGFEKHLALGMPDITDGTSNTLQIVEAGTPVPWTKPEDLAYDPDEPLPELGGLLPGGVQAAFFDGSVHTLKRNVDESVLRAAITRNAGEVIDFNQLQGPALEDLTGHGVARRAGVREANQRLKKELQETKTLLERLQAEVEIAQEMNGADKETIGLLKENAELVVQIHQLKKEAEALADQLQRLKQGGVKPPRKGPTRYYPGTKDAH